MINNHIWSPEFNKREAEIRRLKAELAKIDTEKTQPSLFTQTSSTLVPSPMFDTYAPFYTPSRPQPPVYNQFFERPKSRLHTVAALASLPHASLSSLSRHGAAPQRRHHPSAVSSSSARARCGSAQPLSISSSRLSLLTAQLLNGGTTPRQYLPPLRVHGAVLLSPSRSLLRVFPSPHTTMSNYSRVQDNLDCVADDLEHEVEVNDNENDSATIVTGGNKRKKSSSSKPPLPRKKMAPRSPVWQHFTRVPNDHTKCKCNYCGQEFECGTVGYGTSTLRTHNRERCQTFKDLQKNQTILTQDVGSDEVVARGFSQEACRRASVKMIVLDELPFSVVENAGFRHFYSVAAPRYLLPSRRTISRDTLEMYLEEKVKLKSLLVGNKQRVSLTTDIWTSITTASYMVITAHFIDRDWNLHRKIISFNTVNDHSSETIGKQLEKCLIDWGIERVFTITVDNASPNEGALRYLIDRVKTWRDDGLVLNGDYLHVRCCAHILNLIVTEGLKELEQSIVSVRNAVKYVRSSTARMQAFQIRVQQEKIKCRGSVILDCPTRWNSTYSMLNTALKFKPAFDRMALEDKLYDAYFNEKEGGKKKREGPPLYSDWENTRRIVKFLKTFHDATLQFSSSLKLTLNLY
ncbi:BED-type domain-containing protein [Citrus sinensis]|uniref:BED-type domain-containing protein n=1 Tax=Citrus sinensis TaxID=2711 RepID=A0ACB8L7F6_CITSI|nr:BED-type domain-containing protein [Citrus sinensis]